VEYYLGSDNKNGLVILHGAILAQDTSTGSQWQTQDPSHVHIKGVYSLPVDGWQSKQPTHQLQSASGTIDPKDAPWCPLASSLKKNHPFQQLVHKTTDIGDHPQLT